MTATDTNTEARTLDEALQGLHFAMVGTPDNEVWKSRPLTLAGIEGSSLHFLVSADADWVQSIGTGSTRCGTTFSDPSKNDYVALQGSARALRDQGLIEALWSPEAGAYFEGKDDPNIRVLAVDVERGEYWDSPGGTIGRLLALTKAAAGGDPGKEGPIKL
ncbi:pyridoxamine 5'-phosphate oxidase family protein [Sporichthya sp.]|uniref:pyridoxamine 5'-phosphate oxidase family protein n=1 Tax=Sporichthya sp. TaxID=65475 RepID=UPI0017D22AA3|nr:pyridoxamine 5'-phosphate oxidase family protein [Sporichthya sp.]MBA3744920.1 pyridoxamine 5'-phosphate oxidase family protein [Sporichthya sp.]